MQSELSVQPTQTVAVWRRRGGLPGLPMRQQERLLVSLPAYLGMKQSAVKHITTDQDRLSRSKAVPDPSSGMGAPTGGTGGARAMMISMNEALGPQQ